MITANFIHRSFRIRHKDSIGTGFTIDIGGRQYLVTAKHVVSDIDESADIGILGNQQWELMPVQLVGNAHGSVDITVLAPRTVLTPSGLPVQASSDGMAYGQDVYFLGFPYHFLGNVVFTEKGYPLPFVKRATMSCFAGDAFLLDGHNNPGFSGGPVIFGNPGMPPTNVAAVISGYKFVSEPVYDQDTETEFTYKYNTGIIVAYKIEHALSVISKNPIGCMLEK